MTNPHRQRNRASPEHVESIRNINLKIKQNNRRKALKAKLQNVPGLQKTAYAGIHSAKPVMDAFKNKKPLRFGEKVKGRKREYAFQTDGKTLYQSGYPIAEHTKNGIKFSYQGHPTPTTSDTARYLGIDTFTKNGVTYINGQEIDPYGFDYVEVPSSNISDTPVKVNPKSKPIITEQTKQKNRDQEAFRIKAERESLKGNQDLVVQTKTKKEVLDHGSITSKEQSNINKITGVGKDKEETFATAYDHSLPAEKGGGIGGGIINRRMSGGAVPLSRKTHFEKHFPEKTIPKSFYNKISQLQAKLQKIAAVGMPKGFGKDPEEYSSFSDFLDKFQKGENPDLEPSKYPLPKYFEEDYQSFHDKIQDSAYRFEDASDAGIDIENKENENQLQGNWGDLSETNKGSLRNYYQKHLSNELSWQKDTSIYSSGKLPESQKTYTQPGFHKNIIPDEIDPEGGYATINPKDIKPKFPKDYGTPGQFAKLKLKVALIKENTANQNMQADKIVDSYLSSGLGYKGIDGVYDHENSTVLDGFNDVDSQRMQDLFNGQGKFIGTNSVTDTRAGSNHDIERVRKELREVEEAGGIPALGFDGTEGGSLEALNISVVNSKEEVMNALSNTQWGTGILDPDRKFWVEESLTYKGRNNI